MDHCSFNVGDIQSGNGSWYMGHVHYVTSLILVIECACWGHNFRVYELRLRWWVFVTWLNAMFRFIWKNKNFTFVTLKRYLYTYNHVVLWNIKIKPNGYSGCIGLFYSYKSFHKKLMLKISFLTSTNVFLSPQIIQIDQWGSVIILCYAADMWGKNIMWHENKSNLNQKEKSVQ